MAHVNGIVANANVDDAAQSICGAQSFPCRNFRRLVVAVGEWCERVREIVVVYFGAKARSWFKWSGQCVF